MQQKIKLFSIESISQWFWLFLISEIFCYNPSMKNDILLRLSHVSKKIGKTDILSDISLTLKRGEVFGFLGPNGAGKTTTMKAILGIIEPSEGTIEVFG